MQANGSGRGLIELHKQDELPFAPGPVQCPLQHDLVGGAIKFITKLSFNNWERPKLELLQPAFGRAFGIGVSELL